MSQDENKDYAKLFRDAAVPHALIEQWERMKMLAYVQEKKGWLDAGMPLAKPLKITSKPLKFNKI